MLMRQMVVLILGLLLLAGSAGCGSNPQKGAEKGRDMPKSPEKDG